LGWFADWSLEAISISSAHRLEQAQVVQRGHHDQLMAETGGAYGRLLAAAPSMA